MKKITKTIMVNSNDVEEVIDTINELGRVTNSQTPLPKVPIQFEMTADNTEGLLSNWLELRERLEQDFDFDAPALALDDSELTTV